MEDNKPRIVRATVKIEQIASRNNDIPLVCAACDKMVWPQNMLDANLCPYCHNDVNTRLGRELLSEDSIYEGDDPIAQPC